MNSINNLKMNNNYTKNYKKINNFKRYNNNIYNNKYINNVNNSSRTFKKRKPIRDRINMLLENLTKKYDNYYYKRFVINSDNKLEVNSLVIFYISEIIIDKLVKEYDLEELAYLFSIDINFNSIGNDNSLNLIKQNMIKEIKGNDNNIFYENNISKLNTLLNSCSNILFSNIAYYSNLFYIELSEVINTKFNFDYKNKEEKSMINSRLSNNHNKYICDENYSKKFIDINLDVNNTMQNLFDNIINKDINLDNYNQIKDYFVDKEEHYKNKKLLVYLIKDKLIKFLTNFNKYNDENCTSITTNSKYLSDVIIISLDTGTGKTTQIVQYIIDYYPVIFHNYLFNNTSISLKNYLEYNNKCILISQPRKITCRSASERVKEEIINFNRNSNIKVTYMIDILDTKILNEYNIVFITEYLLLQLLILDPLLLCSDCIILDEAHERTFNMDLILYVLKSSTLIKKSSLFKLILTSATIDSIVFKNYFKEFNCYEIKCENLNKYKINIRYSNYDVYYSEYLDLGIYEIINIINMKNEEFNYLLDYNFNKDNSMCTTILYFLPSLESIKYTENQIIKNCFLHKLMMNNNLKIFKLFSNMDYKDQKFIINYTPKFNQYNQNIFRIILSTNISETSLTISHLDYVIDSGYLKTRRYNHNLKSYNDSIEFISKDSAIQRAGRTGRVKDGNCIRLYSKYQYNNIFKEYRESDIKKSNICFLILKIIFCGVKNVHEIELIDQPKKEKIISSIKDLLNMKAIDLYKDTENNEYHINDFGLFLFNMEIEPFLGRVYYDLINYSLLIINKTNTYNNNNNIRLYNTFLNNNLIISILQGNYLSSNIFFKESRQNNKTTAIFKPCFSIDNSFTNDYDIDNLCLSLTKYSLNLAINNCYEPTCKEELINSKKDAYLLYKIYDALDPYFNVNLYFSFSYLTKLFELGDLISNLFLTKQSMLIKCIYCMMSNNNINYELNRYEKTKCIICKNVKYLFVKYYGLNAKFINLSINSYCDLEKKIDNFYHNNNNYKKDKNINKLYQSNKYLRAYKEEVNVSILTSIYLSLELTNKFNIVDDLLKRFYYNYNKKNLFIIEKTYYKKKTIKNYFKNLIKYYTDYYEDILGNCFVRTFGFNISFKSYLNNITHIGIIEQKYLMCNDNNTDINNKLNFNVIKDSIDDSNKYKNSNKNEYKSYNIIKTNELGKLSNLSILNKIMSEECVVNPVNKIDNILFFSLQIIKSNNFNNNDNNNNYYHHHNHLINNSNKKNTYNNYNKTIESNILLNNNLITLKLFKNFQKSKIIEISNLIKNKTYDIIKINCGNYFIKKFLHVDSFLYKENNFDVKKFFNDYINGISMGKDYVLLYVYTNYNNYVLERIKNILNYELNNAIYDSNEYYYNCKLDCLKLTLKHGLRIIDVNKNNVNNEYFEVYEVKFIKKEYELDINLFNEFKKLLDLYDKYADKLYSTNNECFKKFKLTSFNNVLFLNFYNKNESKSFFDYFYYSDNKHYISKYINLSLINEDIADSKNELIKPNSSLLSLKSSTTISLKDISNLLELYGSLSYIDVKTVVNYYKEEKCKYKINSNNKEYNLYIFCYKDEYSTNKALNMLNHSYESIQLGLSKISLIDNSYYILCINHKNFLPNITDSIIPFFKKRKFSKFFSNLIIDNAIDLIINDLNFYINEINITKNLNVYYHKSSKYKLLIYNDANYDVKIFFKPMYVVNLDKSFLFELSKDINKSVIYENIDKVMTLLNYNISKLDNDNNERYDIIQYLNNKQRFHSSSTFSSDTIIKNITTIDLISLIFYVELYFNFFKNSIEIYGSYYQKLKAKEFITLLSDDFNLENSTIFIKNKVIDILPEENLNIKNATLFNYLFIKRNLYISNKTGYFTLYLDKSNNLITLKGRKRIIKDIIDEANKFSDKNNLYNNIEDNKNYNVLYSYKKTIKKMSNSNSNIYNNQLNSKSNLNYSSKICLICETELVHDTLDLVEDEINQNYIKNNIIILSLCGHFYCRDCIKEYILFKINEGSINMLPIRCLDCNFLIMNKDMLDLFSEKEKEFIYYQLTKIFYQSKKVSNCIDYVWCYNPDCNYLFNLKDFPKQNDNLIQCPNCSSNLCLKCKNEITNNFHVYKCRFNLINKNDDICYKNDVWLQENTVPCPICYQQYEKVKGCNHFKCNQCNNTHFCMICGLLLDKENPLQHYSNKKNVYCFQNLFNENARQLYINSHKK